MPDLKIILTESLEKRAQDAFATDETPAFNMDDLKIWVIRQIRARVLTYERRVQESSIVDIPFDPT
jgi:hypothetical protein